MIFLIYYLCHLRCLCTDIYNIGLYKEECLYDCTTVAAVWKVWPVNQVNHTSCMDVVTPTDHPKSVRNRFVVEHFCGVLLF